MQPLDGLFVNLAQEPNFLASLGGCINPALWLDVIRSHLLEHPDDPETRKEDPQGSSQRFGEGVVLAEAFVFHFKVIYCNKPIEPSLTSQLPLPSLLQDARRAYDFTDLDSSRKACVDGWVKALFGSQGIDDEIILSTSPAEFYRLTASIICQTTLATARGVLDVETLHSGLSYFAQPLLGWSLAGSVSWLADEVIRNGLVWYSPTDTAADFSLISGPYLVVLQALILSSSLPDSILRVAGSRIADILEPAVGLGPVLQSSGFDGNGVKQKLAGLDVVSSLGGCDPWHKTSLTAAATRVPNLKQELQNMKTVELAPSTWSSALLDDLSRSLRVYGLSLTVRSVIDELLSGPTVSLPADSYSALVALVLAHRPDIEYPPLITQAVLGDIPNLLDSASSVLMDSTTAASSTAALARSLKYTLLILSTVDSAIANKCADDLGDELEYQRSRVVEEAQASAVGSVPKPTGGHAIRPEAKAVVDALVGAIGGDEELRNKWQKLEALVE